MKDWCRIIGFMTMAALSAMTAHALDVRGELAGNGSDTQAATFHFKNSNTNFQMTKPDNTALQNAEVAYHYGTTLKVFENGVDVVEKMGLKVEGAGLGENSVWNSLVYPAKNTLAIDPTSGRFKFSPVSSWQTPVLVDNAMYYPSLTYAPRIAMNSSGQTVCVFDQADLSSDPRTYASYYDPTHGWYQPVTLDAGGTESGYADVAINSSGEAFCVFARNETPDPIYAVHYKPSMGWYEEVTVQGASSENAHMSEVAINNAGQAVCAFYHEGAPSTVWANIYLPASGWQGTVEVRYGSLATNAVSPKVAINASGYAVCAFLQEDASGNVDVYANRYIPGSGWEGAVNIDNGTDNDAANVNVAMNDSGQIFCTFAQNDGVNTRIYARRYSAGWSSATTVDVNDTTYAADFPQIAVNGSGTAVCVFNQIDASAFVRTYANRYEPSSGWYGAVSIDARSQGGEGCGLPTVEINDSGQMVCVVAQRLGAIDQVFANAYIPGMGWQGPERISFENENTMIGNVDVALNSSGKGWAAFCQGISGVGVGRVCAAAWDNSVPYGEISVNYHEADPVSTPTPTPESTRVEIVGRKIEPLLGEKTTITYDLHKAGLVSIKVYNLRGELVAALMDRYHEAGSYSLTWAAQNTANQVVASGVYVIHIKTPALTKTQKIVVIK